MDIEPIAHIERSAHGSAVVFEPAYRDRNALRGIEDFSHLWLIWGSDARTPLDPSGLALTAVALKGLEATRARGTALLVDSPDLVDGAPVYDVKPYIPYTDSRIDSRDDRQGS